MKKALSAIVFLMGVTATAYGQGCSVCTKTASELGDKSAKGLNGGIIYLAFLPLAIIGTVGFVWWKNTRSRA